MCAAHGSAMLLRQREVINRTVVDWRCVMFHTADMLKIFQQYRGDAIVVPGRGGRHWVQMSTRPELDAPVGDPAMGGHASFAFGLALAQPDKKVVVFDSEGDLLMSLGVLPT